VRESAELRSAANVLAGSITHPAVAETFGLDYVDPVEAAGRIA
jgi:alanine dehydrogenase